jgi:hypothetical protein
VPPKGLLGNAIGYFLNQWDKLTTFVKDGRLELSNNRAENTIRPVVLGRRNWLFANTLEGARASAIIYSMVETAKENGVNQLSYLTYLFEQLPNRNLDDPAVLDELLPWSATIQTTCQPVLASDSAEAFPALCGWAQGGLLHAGMRGPVKPLPRQITPPSISLSMAVLAVDRPETK